MTGELGLPCPHALQLGAARGLGMLEQERGRDGPEQGALGQLLGGEAAEAPPCFLH